MSVTSVQSATGKKLAERVAVRTASLLHHHAADDAPGEEKDGDNDTAYCVFLTGISSLKCRQIGLSFVFMSVPNIVYWCTFESTTQACERTQIFKAQINVSRYLCVSAIANRGAAASFKKIVLPIKEFLHR